MTKHWEIAPICLGAFVLGGCAGKATPEQCQKACAHVAQLKTGDLQKHIQVLLHEAGGMAEEAQKTARADMERVKKELEAGTPAFDDKPFRARRAPAEEIRAARERHQWEMQQLQAQRQAAIKQGEETVAAEGKRVAELKKKAGEDLARATSEAQAACVERCAKESSKRAECLSRTQAVEDIDLCWNG